MTMPVRLKRRIEFGDFQTPDALAAKVCELLSRMNVAPQSIVEPTCGKGAFLRASARAFPKCDRILGFEVNPDYVTAAETIGCASVQCESFFDKNWPATLDNLPEPILVIGNPPWVTNATISALGGANLPVKSNFRQFNGLEAITGKSNFDISEWMLSHLLEWLSGRSAVVAMLCKTVVARKVLQHAWSRRLRVGKSATYLIDANEHFGASVDACLLVCVLEPDANNRECAVYAGLEAPEPDSAFSLRNGRLIANLRDSEAYEHLYGTSPLKWRSGIKHDCSRVMELIPRGGGAYENGLGDRVNLEPTFLFPMLKSSDLTKAKLKPSRHMLVTQKNIAEDTSGIRQAAPLTWAYLESHASWLDQRSSSIWRNRPRFSVFGVGDYAFAPWKVAISGFYKRLEFRVVGPVDGEPVVFDDTCYFLHCQSEDDASALAEMLGSDLATGFFNSIVFWDAKRPVTAKILGSLNLCVLSAELGVPLPNCAGVPYELPL